MNIKKIVKGLFKTVFFISVFLLITCKQYSTDRYYLENDDGVKIIYQGMVHLANEDYYNNVNTFIDSKKNDGYKHLYELVRVSEGDSEILDKKIKFKLPEIYNDNLIHQNEMFKTDKNDVNADVNSSQLINRIELSELNKIDKFITEQDIINTISPYIICLGLNVSDVIKNYHFKLIDENLYHSIIEYRNDVLIEYIQKEIENGNKKIIISYGNAHFYDFFSKLKKQGFKVKKHEKILAIKNY